MRFRPVLVVALVILTCALKPITPSYETFQRPNDFEVVTYKLTTPETTRIKSEMRRLSATPPVRQNTKVFFTSETTYNSFDSLLPYSYMLADSPALPDHFRWIFSNGRIAEVERVTQGKTQVACRVWYDKSQAPILAIHYDEKKKLSWFAWGDYDAKGYLRRISTFDKDVNPRGIILMIHQPEYRDTDTYHFDAKTGRLTTAAYRRDGKGYQFVNFKDSVTGKIIGERDDASPEGYRLHGINTLKRYGLETLMPIPSP